MMPAIHGRSNPSICRSRMVLAIVLVISVLFVLLNLIIDLLYGVIDPRVRRG